MKPERIADLLGKSPRSGAQHGTSHASSSGGARVPDVFQKRVSRAVSAERVFASVPLSADCRTDWVRRNRRCRSPCPCIVGLSKIRSWCRRHHHLNRRRTTDRGRKASRRRGRTTVRTGPAPPGRQIAKSPIASLDLLVLLVRNNPLGEAFSS